MLHKILRALPSEWRGLCCHTEQSEVSFNIDPEINSGRQQNVMLNCLRFCFTKSRCSLHFVVVCLTFCSFVSALPLRTTQNPLVSASFEHDIYKILSNRFFGLFKTSEWRLKCFSVILSGFSVEWSRAKRAELVSRRFSAERQRQSLKVKSRKSTARKSKTAKRNIFSKSFKPNY